MSHTHLSFVFLIVFGLAVAACSGAASAIITGKEDCPVTIPDDPETGLYGPETALSVFVSDEGVWRDLPHSEAGYSQKIFWKYPGYDLQTDPTPQFTLEGEQLDGDGIFKQDGFATNAFQADLLGSAILTGVTIPEGGCWQISGKYLDSQLSFVVWVE